MSEFVGIEKISLVDFDGKIACTLFSAGCNFRCPFCHNSSLVVGSNPNFLSFKDIISFLKTRVNKIDAVCITGGEPTLIKDLSEKLKQIKELGFLIKLDTNGYKPHTLKSILDLGLVDYVAMDIKNTPSKYAITSGISNLNLDLLNQSINFLKNGLIEYEFRITLVEEFHTEQDIEDIGQWLKGSKKIYLQKFIDNDQCIKKNLHPIETKQVLRFKEILNKYFNEVHLRGY